MKNMLVFPAGTGKSVCYAAHYLQKNGIPLVDHPTPDVTHLLLDVPTKEFPRNLLEELPESVTIVGGNLSVSGYSAIDLLKNQQYLAKNAAITAHCAIQVTAEHLDRIITDLDALIIGWGRIGKCLSALLNCLGCRVTVAARKETDRAMAEALGNSSLDIPDLANLQRFDVIYNTVPAPLPSMSATGLKIELASHPGLIGNDVILARGLPGRYAPESSGILIGETFLKEVGK